LQGDAVFALGAAVYNKNVHGAPPFVFLYHTTVFAKMQEAVTQ
jgi:hypothetical protein